MNPAMLCAALLSLGPLGLAHGPRVAPVRTAAATTTSSAVTVEPCTALPGVPRGLEARVVGDQVVLTWRAPVFSGCTALAGYVVLSSPGETFVVDAATTHVTLPYLPGQRFAVASTNEVGCSVHTAWVAPSAVVMSASTR